MHAQASDDGSKYGPDKHAGDEQRGGDPTADGVPDIEHEPTAVCERRDGEEAAEEARREERVDVLREGLAEVEDGVRAEGEEEDRAAAQQLRARAPEQGPDHVAAEEDGRDEVRVLVLLVELGRDGETCGGGRG